MSQPGPVELEAARREWSEGSLEFRALVCAPTGNDGPLTCKFLENALIAAEVCRDPSELAAEVKRGCGFIVMAEETLGGAINTDLVETLRQQPPWSDIPVALITSSGDATRERLQRHELFGAAGNV